MLIRLENDVKATINSHKIKGFKPIEKYRHSAYSDFVDMWKEEGVYAIAFSGHGLKDKSGIYMSYDAETTDAKRKGIGPPDVAPPYKLSWIMAYHCGATELIWERHAARAVYSMSGAVGYMNYEASMRVEIPNSKHPWGRPASVTPGGPPK